MKTICFAVFLSVLGSTTYNSFGQEPRKNITGDFLLKTQWGSDKLNCKYTPGNAPLGCHSIAIAQVLYYHKLAPTGKVSYICSNGDTIIEDFTNYRVNWKKITNKLTESSPVENNEETAFYNYAVACIVQKDFATDQYIGIEKSDNHKSQIEEHFKCRYDSYTFVGETSVSNMFKNRTFENTIKKEIDAKRPVGLYFIWKESGHAIVIDGYTIIDQFFYVHANYGWMGICDGWYLMPEDLPETTNLAMLLTIDPL